MYVCYVCMLCKYNDDIEAEYGNYESNRVVIQ